MSKSKQVVLWSGLLGLALFLPLLARGADAAQAGLRLGMITGEKVNLRSGPSRNHHTLAQLNRGAQLAITGEEDGWYRVLLPENVPVWIKGEYVADGRVTGSLVMVRPTPGTTHTPVGEVARGTRLELTGRKDKTGEWIEVSPPDGVAGYVHADFARVEREIAPGEVAAVLAGGGVKRTAAGENAVPVSVDPKTPAEPAVASDMLSRGPTSSRLARIYERYREERKKKVLDWNFDSIRTELMQIQQTSEDVVEAEFAAKVLDVIAGDIALRDDYQEIEKRRQAANEQLAEGEQKESDIPRSVQIPPVGGPVKEFQATGWVVMLGKHPESDGTHKLMKGNRLLYYLKSDQFNLDNFVNKCVGIRGNFKELAAPASDLIEVTEISVLSQ